MPPTERFSSSRSWTDDQHGVRVFRQVGLEPKRAFEVEVVCRLVEQQQVGLREQNGGQGHAHPPAA